MNKRERARAGRVTTCVRAVTLMWAARLAARLMAGPRRRLIVPLAVVALAATFVVDIPAAPASCANPIVCENELPGTPDPSGT